MQLEASCPHCGKRYKITQEMLGKEAHCKAPGCGRGFVVAASAQPVDEGAAMPTARLSEEPGVLPPPPGGVPAVPPSAMAGSAAPPPLPGVAASGPPPLVPDRPADVDAILSGYRSAARPARPGVMDSLRQTFRSAKKRAHLLGLRREVKGLDSAVESQLEGLGTLALTHRPPGLDVAAETSEMATIQGTLVQQQATLDSLKATKGSGPVVRDLRRQMDQEHHRQRVLMIAIGAKTEAAKPELPGAGGAYSALEHLRASVQAKRSELQALEAELGAKAGTGSGIGAMKVPALAAAAVVCVALVGYLLWIVGRGMFGGGIPSWAVAAIPPNAKTIGYVNVDRLRSNPLFKDFEKSVTGELPRDVKLRIEDVQEAFFVGDDSDKNVAMLRTRQDFALTDLLAKSNRTTKPMTHKTAEYVRAADGWVAKTGKNTFCIAQSEDHLKETLDRLAKGEKAALDKDLQRILDQVATGDLYVAAGKAPSLPRGGMPFGPIPMDFLGGVESAGLSAKLGSSIAVEGLAFFGKETEAADCVKGVGEAIKGLEQMMGMFGGDKEGKKMIDMLHAVKFAQRGKAVHFSGSWKVADIQDLAKSAGKGSPFGM